MAIESDLGNCRLTPAAQADLDDIFDYTVMRWGLTQAIDYTQQLWQACVDLAATPQQAQRIDHLRAGYSRHAVGRHTIYFQTHADGIVIVRILHQRMDAIRHL